MTDGSVIWPPSPAGQPTPPEPPRLSWWQNLFVVPAGPATAREVIDWWETRRWTYNKLVFGLGIPSFLLYVFFVATAANLPPGEDIVEPLALLAAPILAPIAVNVCYTLGRVVELIWRAVSKDQTRRAGLLFMRLGVGFTLFVILTPSIAWGVVWVWHLIIGHKVNTL